MFRFAQEEPTVVDDPEVVHFFNDAPKVVITSGNLLLFRERAAIGLYPEPQLVPHSCTVGIIVPAYVSPVEFLLRLKPYCSAMNSGVHILVPTGNYCPVFMVVIAVSEQSVADAIHTEFHCQSFAEQYPQYMLVLYLANHTLVNSNNNNTTTTQTTTTSDNELTHPASSSRVPRSEWDELPCCPHCLERLDSSISGLICTMCIHQKSKCDCSLRSNCTVCRLVTNTDNTRDEAQCQQCGAKTSVWACLVCGFTGCSRYNRMHAVHHQQEAYHNYTIELSSQRIWDYGQDQFCHRLLSRVAGGDGEQVEVEFLPDPNDDMAMPEVKEFVDSKLDHKIEAISDQFSTTLEEELAKQRIFYTRSIEMKTSSRQQQINNLEKELHILQQRNRFLHKRTGDLEQQCTSHSEHLTKSQNHLEVQKNQLLQAAEDNKLLSQQQEQLRKRMEILIRSTGARREALRERISETKECIADMQRELSFRRQLAASNVDQSEIKNSVIIVAEPTGGRRGGPRWRRQHGRR